MIKKNIKIAEDEIDIYPRLNGPKEWDTAAPEIILTEAGCSLVSYSDRIFLDYNKLKIANPFFVASRNVLSWQ